MAAKKIKPGTPAPDSGQYRPVGGGNEVTAIQGKPLPPTPKPGQGWKLVDKTKHKPKGK
ncbi:YjzC family protein [Streptomyces olivaceus]|uniref:YjzC family protein n=1 Tax=Streptomyces olivaceus TaxID=47716 RepID=UPI001CCAC8F5|nr:YjzC family protein [Streptomyces olivaceus]MBZ6248795.1 YjzC family protein [Streptomyces olivaceus]